MTFVYQLPKRGPAGTPLKPGDIIRHPKKDVGLKYKVLDYLGFNYGNQDFMMEILEECGRPVRERKVEKVAGCEYRDYEVVKLAD
jgi:hypothetical protein